MFRFVSKFINKISWFFIIFISGILFWFGIVISYTWNMTHDERFFRPICWTFPCVIIAWYIFLMLIDFILKLLKKYKKNDYKK